MWRIVERLYLGDYQSGRDALAGAQRPTDPDGVEAPFSGVVSLCPMPLVSSDRIDGPANDATEWLELPILDGGNGEDEFRHALGVALPFVARRKQRGNVLVHCAAGMSRSVSVIAAVLCESGLAVEDAFERVRDAKANALGPFSADLDLLICPAWEFRSCLRRLYEARPVQRPGGA